MSYMRRITLEDEVDKHELLLAYIDPFSGSMLIQMIIAGFIGGLAFCRKWIAKVVGKSPNEDDTPSEPGDD